ncbi:MAG: hypothetical protein JNL21_22150 [Myxococcales bacterium]|nr:hypothetical protein [Myxococcales bacterium]
MDRERFLRQILLPEIGEDGQRAIGSATAPVLGPTLAHEVARLYAERAGFAELALGPAALDAGAPAAWIETEAAREVLAGARAALRAIVAALPARPGGA